MQECASFNETSVGPRFFCNHDGERCDGLAMMNDIIGASTRPEILKAFCWRGDFHGRLRSFCEYGFPAWIGLNRQAAVEVFGLPGAYGETVEEERHRGDLGMWLVSDSDVNIGSVIEQARDFLCSHKDEEIFGRVDLCEPGLERFAIHSEMHDGARPVAENGTAVDAGLYFEAAAEALDYRGDRGGEGVILGGDNDVVGAKSSCDEGDMGRDAFVSCGAVAVA